MVGEGVVRWALMGAAGYVAPRHMQAIAEVGGELVAACDPHDSVGVLDRHAPRCRFFTDTERFFHHIRSNPVDGVAICTPNHLHVAHACRAMDLAPLVVCEKPLALNREGLDELAETEALTGSRLAAVLQLRHHHAFRSAMKNAVGIRNVEVRYITPRGPWYGTSWKGDGQKSGGLAMNIGIHLFDLCIQLLGPVSASEVDYMGCARASGRLWMKCGATVEWHLATEGAAEPTRVFTVDGEPMDLSNASEELHTAFYRDAVQGGAPGIEDARPSVKLVSSIRRQA